MKSRKKKLKLKIQMKSIMELEAPMPTLIIKRIRMQLRVTLNSKISKILVISNKDLIARTQ